MWANARNDLISGQIPGLLEGHVTELYYGGNVLAAPGPVKDNRKGGPENEDFYSFLTGEMSVDDTGQNYDDEYVDAAIDRIKPPVDDRPVCIFLGLMYPHPHIRWLNLIFQPLTGLCFRIESDRKTRKGRQRFWNRSESIRGCRNIRK